MESTFTTQRRWSPGKNGQSPKTIFCGWPLPWITRLSFSERKTTDIPEFSLKFFKKRGSVVKSDHLPVRAYLLYDSRCSPCTSFVKFVKMLDFHRILSPVSIHSEHAEHLVRGHLSTSRLKSSFHLVEVQDLHTEIFSAGDGIVRLTRYAPGGKFTFTIVNRIKSLRQAIRWSYFQMTRIRLASKTCSVGEV